MATPITIHGGQGSDTISFAFTVTGTNTTHYANLFANNVNSLLGTDSTSPVAPNTQTNSIGTFTAGDPPVYVLVAPTGANDTTPSPSYTISNPGYVLDTISGGATISIAGSDTVLVAAINAEATITGAGSNNQVTFVTGENEYIGNADVGGDTLVAGSGFDTIYTSLNGVTTVNSGTGSLTAYLQDTTTGHGVNDYVWLDDGASTIYADGTDDAVIATVGSQTIYGDSVTAANTIVRVELTNQGPSTSPVGNDTVSALLSDTVAVFDYTSANLINGGTGTLYFVAGDSISASVHAGSGTAYLFGGAGDSVTLGALGDTAVGGSVYFVSGGNETLNGAAETGTLYAFAGSGDSLSGGKGINVLTAANGSETLAGGTGTNYFNISDTASGGADLVLSDFSTDGTSDLVLSDGFTQADVAAIENSTNDVAGNLVVSLHDGTQLTFTGITSGSQLTGHITLQ